jgi:hypothetical protein
LLIVRTGGNTTGWPDSPTHCVRMTAGRQWSFASLSGMCHRKPVFYDSWQPMDVPVGLPVESRRIFGSHPVGKIDDRQPPCTARVKGALLADDKQLSDGVVSDTSTRSDWSALIVSHPAVRRRSAFSGRWKGPLMDTTLFRCAECGYRADVLGASHRSAESKHKSMVCRSCRVIVVAVVARLVPGQPKFGMSTDRWHSISAVCPHCGAEGLLPWPPTHPCPRCGSEMEED